MNELENLKYEKAMLEEYKEKTDFERTQNYIKELEQTNEDLLTAIEVTLDCYYSKAQFELPDFLVRQLENLVKENK